MNRNQLKLYLVTDSRSVRSGNPAAANNGRSLEDIVEEAVKGGVTMVQLREKNLDTGKFVEEAVRLRKMLKQYGVPLIINDRVDVALASGADGVHIGQSDMSYADARRLLGPDRIIGLSVENLDQVVAANSLDVDYIGVSPLYSTPTKTDTAPPFGIGGLREAVRLSVHPVVAIGGINEGNAAAVFDSGADGIAVVSAIMASPSPRQASARLLSLAPPDSQDALQSAPLSFGPIKGEFEFIEEIRKSFSCPDDILGIGDDCSVIPQHDGFETLVSTDMLVEGTHFILSEISPYRLGWKSAASSMSDIAAMGGSPVGSFLALALPRNISSGWAEDFLRGYGDISRQCGFPLLGGDTTASVDRISVCVTVIGKTGSGLSRKRSLARAGDLVCVSGPLGDSAAGLKAILDRIPVTDDVKVLIERHYLPVPRIEEGIALASSPGVHAMMDISDGLGSDLRHIAKESGVGFEIDLGKLPLSEHLRTFCARNSLDIFSFALEGGEDYELLFTADPAAEPLLEVSHTVIGRVTSGEGIVWLGGPSDSPVDYMGYRHF